MEIVEFAVKKRASYEKGSEDYPFIAHIILKDGGSTYQPDIRQELTAEIVEGILGIVNPIAVKAFNQAAREFQHQVASSLTCADQPQLTIESATTD